LNEEGLARFCTQDYEKPTKDNIDNLSIHLTNYSQNKTNDDYVFSNELTEDNNGSKRTLTSYWKAIERNGFNSKSVILPTFEDRKILIFLRSNSDQFLDKEENRAFNPTHVHLLAAFLKILQKVDV
jgi:hypothetical protein